MLNSVTRTTSALDAGKSASFIGQIELSLSAVWWMPSRLGLEKMVLLLLLTRSDLTKTSPAVSI